MEDLCSPASPSISRFTRKEEAPYPVQCVVK
jgi:hypothetical protein